MVSNITVKLTVKVAFKGQRLSKFDLCPVCPDCPAPEDTILTSWGQPISSYQEVISDGTRLVNPGYALFCIQRYATYNKYLYLYNGTQN